MRHPIHLTSALALIFFCGVPDAVTLLGQDDQVTIEPVKITDS